MIISKLSIYKLLPGIDLTINTPLTNMVKVVEKLNSFSFLPPAARS